MDQKPNIELIATRLRAELGSEWTVHTFWGFENLEVDVIAINPSNGIAIFRVASLPDGYLFSDRDNSIQRDKENESRDQALLISEDIDLGLLANPREQIEHWRNAVQILLASSAPNTYQQFLAFGLLLFQNGENLQKNFDYLKGKKNREGNCKISIEAISDHDSITRLAPKLIPFSGDKARKAMPAALWTKIQLLIIGDPSIIIEGLPPANKDFDAEQVKFVQRVANQRYSRLMGPAGSGKTTVVCRLAADALLKDERVLIVARNKSICPLIKGRIQRYVVDAAETKIQQHDLIRKLGKKLTVIHQEAWWEEIFANTGKLGKSKTWYSFDIEKADETGLDDDRRAVEKNQLTLVHESIELLNQYSENPVEYDLVIVDEAQNMLVENWEALKKMVKPDSGRAIVIADPSQSLYGKRPWTDDRMSGFVGPWSRLSGAHRIPSNCVRLIHQFSEEFPVDSELLLPKTTDQDDLFFPDANLWHVDLSIYPDLFPADIIANAVLYMRDIEGYKPNEIAFLVSRNKRGFEVVKKIRKLDPTLETTTSFNKFTRYELGLGLGVRGSTVHSFAGWESPCLIIDLDIPDIIEGHNSIIYSAITRIRKRSAGSDVVFIYGDNDFSRFFRNFTKQLPLFG